MEPLKVKVARESLAAIDVRRDCEDKDLGRMASYVFGRTEKPPELGAIAHALATFTHSKRRAQTSKFLKSLHTHISSCRDPNYFADQMQFVTQTSRLTKSYRNPAAHIGYMSKQAYDECRGMLMGTGGTLWQLVAAIG